MDDDQAYGTRRGSAIPRSTPGVGPGAGSHPPELARSLCAGTDSGRSEGAAACRVGQPAERHPTDDQHRAHGPEIPDPRPERERLAALRCFLFLPGSRPELLAKAVATGADGVCADLEDAVGPDGRDAAGQSVVGLLQGEAGAHLKAPGSPYVIVRVNGPDTPAGR